MRQWQKNLFNWTLALVILIGLDLPSCRAQLEFNGGYVQTHREDHGEVSHLASPQRGARSPTNPPSSYFPDHDFYYPSYYWATPSLLRSSSYFAAGASGRSLLSPAGRPPFGVSADSLPWNLVGFKDYDEIEGMKGDSARKYSLAATPLPQASPAERPEAAVLIAHLPEHAVFWVEGTRTRSTGRTRYFQSPLLLPGRKYRYQVRADWIENGRWVSQTRKLLVQAGLIQAIYLRAE